MLYTNEFFRPLEIKYTLESLQFADPKFKPENYDRIPPPEERITPLHSNTGEVIQDLAVREKFARQFIKEALEKRHGRKVISHDEYVNLRGLASIPTYESVQAGETIVL